MPEAVTSNLWVFGVSSRLGAIRCIVLTTEALYRCQYLPLHGFVNRCKRTPLGAVSRVYEEADKIVVQERISRNSRLHALTDRLFSVDAVPAGARPWRTKTHSLLTRWYAPQSAKQMSDMTRAMNVVASWSRPVTRGSETDSCVSELPEESDLISDFDYDQDDIGGSRQAPQDARSVEGRLQEHTTVHAPQELMLVDMMDETCLE